VVLVVSVVVAGAEVVVWVAVFEVVVVVDMVVAVDGIDENVEEVEVELNVDSGELPPVDPSTTLAEFSEDSLTSATISETVDVVAMSLLMIFSNSSKYRVCIKTTCYLETGVVWSTVVSLFPAVSRT
jgi:hypothetical protein